ncbi:chromo shadow domain protein [Ancylostoma caninum]|uniref:Chromo shadow domain protein n=1 Tax=Ancylostoma caninum TaxID=29170 RepID=A0A368G688_ANCCA|nr:chromo shadow domain protein [Ancylostoma caninum]
MLSPSRLKKSSLFPADDTKYGVCEGRKISRILGLNTTSSEVRMLIVYSDTKKVHKRDAELVPSRILRHYAPQMVIDYYESLIIKGNYE